MEMRQMSEKISLEDKACKAKTTPSKLKLIYVMAAKKMS